MIKAAEEIDSILPDDSPKIPEIKFIDETSQIDQLRVYGESNNQASKVHTWILWEIIQKVVFPEET